MKKLYRLITSGRSIDDEILSLLQDIGNELRKSDPRGAFATASKYLPQIITAYNVLFANRYQTGSVRAEAQNKAISTITKVLDNARPNDISVSGFLSRLTEIRGLSQIQPRAFPETTTPVQDPENPGWLKFPGVNLLATQYGVSVAQQLGNWVRQKRVPKSDKEETLILGNKEPWDLFRQLAAQLFHNDSSIPTSQQLGLQPLGEKRELDTTVKPISITSLNTGNEKYWNVHKKKDLPPGIRITFQPSDTNFWKIRDFVAKGEEAFSDARIGQHIIDIYDLDAYKLQSLSKMLTATGYGQFVGPLNDLILKFTGKSYGDIAEERAKDKKGQPLPPKLVNNAMDRNLGLDKNTKLITANTPFDENFRQTLSENYPGAFNPNTLSARQIAAQQQGVHFMITRQSSVEADAPGSGKTVMTIVAADYATKVWGEYSNGNYQKVLVFTPPQLVDEHWTNDIDNADPASHKSDKPTQYLGPDEAGKVLVVNNFATLQKAKQSGDWNSKKWIVVPYSALGMTADANQLAQALANEVKQKTFALSMADEIQTQKDFGEHVDSASDTLKNMDLILSGSMDKAGTLNLPHRVAMSGTPADNSPADMFSVMRATRHPVIYNDNTTQLYQQGFVAQIMGNKNLKQYKETENNIERGDLALNELVNWAKNTDPKQRDANLRMFGETFIRRTKKDIRPDMPDKAPREQTHVQTAEQWPEVKGPNAKQKQDRQMALAKIGSTVSSAVQYLTDNPDKKVFIVSYYPEVVDRLANGINQFLGHGTAAAVHGGTDDKTRSNVARSFQNGHQLVQGMPFRAACYSLGIGAVGLNFASAQKIIFNDIDWNPSKNLQADDRIHRINMPATQIAERQYMIIPGTRDEEKFNRVMRKERVNDTFHKTLESVTTNGLQPEMADAFMVEMIDEMMFEFNRDDMAQIGNEKGKLDQLIDIRKQELMHHFAQQRVHVPRKRKTAPPVAASNWFKQLRLAAQSR